jgi:hypothetical protein
MQLDLCIKDKSPIESFTAFFEFEGKVVDVEGIEFLLEAVVGLPELLQAVGLVDEVGELKALAVVDPGAILRLIELLFHASALQAEYVQLITKEEFLQKTQLFLKAIFT